MGLLNRRRSAPGADRGRAASLAPSPPEEADGAREVFRPGSFSQVPEWAKLPPMELSLPEMPSVVSKHFDDSLTSWQAPARFLGSLGHSVTPEAPAGVVQGMAVLVPPVVDRETPVARAPVEALPLAVPPPHPADGGGRAPDSTTRRLPAPVFEAEAGPREELAAAFDAGATGPAPAESVTPAEAVRSEPPAAGLVGTEPLVAAPQPLVVPMLSPAAPSRFVSAVTPPDLPLALLPSARLSQVVPSPAARPEPASLVDPTALVQPVAAERPLAGLVGDRPMATRPEAPAPPGGSPTVSATPPVPSTEPSGAELPLAAPAPARPIPADPTRRIDAEVPSLEPPASEVPAVPPGDVRAEDVQAEVAPPAAAAGPAPAPVTVEPARPAQADPIAPLVGQAPPLVAGRPEVGPTASDEPVGGQAAVSPPLAVPPPRPRAGLGEPLAELPSSAKSWDITRMSRAEQLQASRGLIQSQMAAAARSMPPVGEPMSRPPAGPLPLPPAGAAGPGPLPLAGPRGPSSTSQSVSRAAEGPVLAGMALPVAPIESIGPTSMGVEPGDLPAAGRVQAPLLGATPIFTSEPEAVSASSAAPAEGQRARTEIGGRYGVDLSRVPIDRSAFGAGEASRLRARAFTSNLAVVIPPAAGSLDSGTGEALLSHELTHVAQRVRSGPGLPSEDTPAGQVLEGEALAAEMTLSRAGAGRPAVSAGPGTRPANTWAGALGGQASALEGAASLPLASPASPGPDPDSLANTIMERLSGLTTPAPAGLATNFGAPLPVSAPAAPVVSAGPIQRAAEAPTLPDSGPAPTGPAPVDTGAPMARPSDEDLTNLSRWLYPLIKYRLKGDLREDRERAGLLTDHYGRW